MILYNTLECLQQTEILITIFIYFNFICIYIYIFIVFPYRINLITKIIIYNTKYIKYC